MPRETRVPGHTPLTPSPLMRRKPQHVTLAAAAAAVDSDTTADAPRSVTPYYYHGVTEATRPQTSTSTARLAKMIADGTTAVGGAGGGPLAVLTTLKSDLVMIQAELDAMTPSTSGRLELQALLARFTGAADERTNLEASNTLLSLTLLKLNELARVHAAVGGDGPAAAVPRQSRVGDLVAYFRDIRRARDEAAAARQTVRGAGDGGVEDINWTTVTPAQRHHHAITSTTPEREVTTPNARALCAVDDDLPHVVSPPSHNALVPELKQVPAAMRDVATDTDPPRVTEDALERKLALFRHLEPAFYSVDLFDSTLKHCSIHAALAELGIDTSRYRAPLPPPHTVTKGGVFRPAAAPAVAATAPVVKPAVAQDGSIGAADPSPVPEGGIAEQQPASADPATVHHLRNLVAFQNATVSLLLEALRETKAAVPSSDDATRSSKEGLMVPSLSPPTDGGVQQQKEMEEPDHSQLAQRIARLEKALVVSNEQLALERRHSRLAHEREAYLTAAPFRDHGTRSSTPGVPSRPGTVALSTDVAAARPSSRALPVLPPVPTLQHPPGVMGSSLPVLPTRREDVPVTYERDFRRALTQQGSIIRDLQRRVATPDAALPH